jgi:excisionase family DNA binding protein
MIAQDMAAAALTPNSQERKRPGIWRSESRRCQSSCRKQKFNEVGEYIEVTHFGSSRVFLGLETAAELVGVTTRHFRRIVEEDGIRTIQIGRKCFILGTDFSDWARSRNLQDLTERVRAQSG